MDNVRYPIYLLDSPPPLNLEDAAGRDLRRVDVCRYHRASSCGVASTAMEIVPSPIPLVSRSARRNARAAFQDARCRERCSFTQEPLALVGPIHTSLAPKIKPVFFPSPRCCFRMLAAECQSQFSLPARLRPQLNPVAAVARGAPGPPFANEVDSVGGYSFLWVADLNAESMLRAGFDEATTCLGEMERRGAFRTSDAECGYRWTESE